MFSVEIDGERKQIKLSSEKTLKDLMKTLGLSTEEYLCVLNGSVVIELETFNPDDKIKFVKVWSGG